MPILRSYHHEQPEYALIQRSVAAHFLAHHRARPDPRPEEFWSLLAPCQIVPGLACLGLCWGDHGPLFSEHYLPGARICADDDRRGLVEIGQIASFVPGAGSRLLELTVVNLAQRNFRYAVMTATVHVRSILGALGMPFAELGIAERRHCRDAHVDWGTYYCNDPRVIRLELQPLARTLASDAERRRAAADRSFGPPHVGAVLTDPRSTSSGASNVVAA